MSLMGWPFVHIRPMSEVPKAGKYFFVASRNNHTVLRQVVHYFEDEEFSGDRDEWECRFPNAEWRGWIYEEDLHTLLHKELDYTERVTSHYNFARTYGNEA